MERIFSGHVDRGICSPDHSGAGNDEILITIICALQIIDIMRRRLSRFSTSKFAKKTAGLLHRPLQISKKKKKKKKKKKIVRNEIVTEERSCIN